jgi:Fe-S cluster assembly iron-binding protein IscA
LKLASRDVIWNEDAARVVASRMAPRISVTDGAAVHLREELAGRLLRIAFTTGCGGSGYRLSLASEPMDGDRLVTVGDIRVALDDMSASRLDGAIIKWDDAEDGFTLDHPDAVTAVWCG